MKIKDNYTIDNILEQAPDKVREFWHSKVNGEQLGYSYSDEVYKRPIRETIGDEYK